MSEESIPFHAGRRYRGFTIWLTATDRPTNFVARFASSMGEDGETSEYPTLEEARRIAMLCIDAKCDAESHDVLEGVRRCR